MILCIPLLILFLALVTSNKRYWVISAKRRSLRVDRPRPVVPCDIIVPLALEINVVEGTSHSRRPYRDRALLVVLVTIQVRF
jgi:hypothetical protein